MVGVIMQPQHDLAVRILKFIERPHPQKWQPSTRIRHERDMTFLDWTCNKESRIDVPWPCVRMTADGYFTNVRDVPASSWRVIGIDCYGVLCEYPCCRQDCQIAVSVWTAIARQCPPLFTGGVCTITSLPHHSFAKYVGTIYPIAKQKKLAPTSCANFAR